MPANQADGATANGEQGDKERRAGEALKYVGLVDFVAVGMGGGQNEQQTGTQRKPVGTQ